MARKLLTYLAIYALGVASTAAVLAVLPAAVTRSVARTPFAASVAERTARVASGTRCPVIAAAETAAACPFASSAAVTGCPHLESLAAGGTCPYLARRAQLACPFLAAHPELGTARSQGCPERDRGLATLPSGSTAPSGVVTAELGAGPRSSIVTPDPT